MKYLRFPLIVAVLFVAMAMAVPAAFAQNLLVNPGFEDGDATTAPPWSSYGQGNPNEWNPAMSGPTSEIAHTGLRSVKVWGTISTAAGYFGGAAQLDVSVVVGEYYKFSAWFKVTDLATQQIKIRAWFWGTPGSVDLIGPLTPPNTDWNQLEVIVQAVGSPGTVRFWPVMSGATTENVGYIDDCSLTLIPEPGSLFALGLGLAALATRLRRRK